MAFLGHLEKTLTLDTLTIGPMGKTVFLPGPELVTENLGYFRGLKIEPSVLRVDSFRFAPNCAVFSARLTTIEMFSVPDVNSSVPIFELWREILRGTPNLISLTLWHQASWGSYLDNVPEDESKMPISLPFLKQLSLSTSYLEIILLLSYSPLPKLKSLRIDSSSSKNIPFYIGRLANVAPCLSSLALSCSRKPNYRAEVWNEAFQKLQSLQHLTLFEMDQSVARKIIELERLPKTLASVWLERTYGHDAIRWPPSNTTIESLPTLSFRGYNNVVRIRSADDSYRVICLDNYDKENVEDDPADTVYHSRETDIYVGEDLAMVRGPNPDLTDTDDSASEDGASNTDDNSDEHDEEHDRTSGDDSDDSDSEASSASSWGTNASFASGDFYVLAEETQESSDEYGYSIDGSSTVSV
ncbi:hypothetical protein FRC07_002555 [Ceratobasidium sp. 392]|nr:hypothetical protein FRC07_002555 [Ceratobasidium sp. 392]